MTLSPLLIRILDKEIQMRQWLLKESLPVDRAAQLNREIDELEQFKQQHNKVELKEVS